MSLLLKQHYGLELGLAFLSPCVCVFLCLQGVAFEQGKVLPTPETVPFRLSRDIVDGMGITGVEGVFRRSDPGKPQYQHHSLAI